MARMLPFKKWDLSAMILSRKLALIELRFSASLLMVLMLLSLDVHGQSFDKLKDEEERARLAYEAAKKNRLSFEIKQDEQRLAEKKAEYAKMGNSVASPDILKSGLPDTDLKNTNVAEVARAAADTNTKVTNSISNKNGTTIKTTEAVPFSQAELRDGAPKRDFGGIKFGVGIAYTLDTGRFQRVREAELVNGVVRVKHSEQSSARIVLESHYLFTPFDSSANNFMDSIGVGKNIRGSSDGMVSAKTNWGIGPFVAIQPGTDNIIDSLGTGFMIGFRRADK